MEASDINADLAIKRPPSLKDIVARRIAEMIHTGTLQPGNRLVESRLAQQFKTSRGPIRDAFKLLETEGLVEIRGTKGAYVAKPSSTEVEQMFVMRATLEGLAARYAATSASLDQIEALERIVGSMSEAAKSRDFEAFRNLDWDFHEGICRISGIPALIQSWRSMKNLIRVYQKANLATNDDLIRTAANHLDFIKAIRKGDPDRAEDLFRSRLVQRGYELVGKAPPPALSGLIR